MRVDTTEAPLLRGAIQLLHLLGYRAFRVNWGAVKLATGHWVKLAPKGTADVIGQIPRSGRVVVIAALSKSSSSPPSARTTESASSSPTWASLTACLTSCSPIRGCDSTRKATDSHPSDQPQTRGPA